MKKTPLELVRERFESKEKLIEAVEALATEELWLDRLNPDKSLKNVSNSKLLRLHAVLTEVKQRWGNREKLIEATLDLMNRTQDEGFRIRLGKHPTPRLLDAYKSGERRVKAAQRKGESAPAKKAQAAAQAKATQPKKKTPRTRKAQAKAAAAV